ncbi:hypothetical protein SAMN04487985_10115 [Aerococcus urinaehominis]|nr:hypothetical protein SAMN04487985_10115 [Aerococcus urinaehominis]
MMLTTKTRKQGNSVVVTLPVDDEHVIQTQKEYIVTYTESGSIILTPIIADPFQVEEEGIYYEADVWADINQAGEELL